MIPSPSALAKSSIACNLELFATDGDICALTDIAIARGFDSILVYPTSVSLCADILYDSEVQLNCTIAYPHGRSTTESKCAEINAVAKLGAQAVTVFLNYSALRSGEKNLINEEIEIISKLTKQLKIKLTCAVEASILKQKQLKYVIQTCANWKVDSFLTSYGSTFSECCSHLNDISDRLKSEVKILSFLNKFNKKDAEKLLKLGAHKILICENIEKIK